MEQSLGLSLGCERELSSTVSVRNNGKRIQSLLDGINDTGGEKRFLLECLFDADALLKDEDISNALHSHGLGVKSADKIRLRTELLRRTVKQAFTFKGHQQVPKSKSKHPDSIVKSIRSEASLPLTDEALAEFTAQKIPTVEAFLEHIRPHREGSSVRMRLVCPTSVQAAVAETLGVDVPSLYPDIHIDVFPGSGGREGTSLIKTDVEVKTPDMLALCFRFRKDVMNVIAEHLNVDIKTLYREVPPARKSLFAADELARQTEDPWEFHHPSTDAKDLRAYFMQTLGVDRLS